MAWRGERSFFIAIATSASGQVCGDLRLCPEDGKSVRVLGYLKPSGTGPPPQLGPPTSVALTCMNQQHDCSFHKLPKWCAEQRSHVLWESPAGCQELSQEHLI